MPGLRRQPGISSYTNSIYHADMHTTTSSSSPFSSPGIPKYYWDRENSVVLSSSSRRVITTRPLKWGLGRDYLGIAMTTTATKAVLMSTAPAVAVGYGGGSNESDDLQAMVHDFIENDPLDFLEGGDPEAPSPGKRLIETLQMRTATLNGVERELLTEVKLRLLSIKEDADLVCYEPEDVDCKGVCVKRLVVKHLKAAGYDAAVCMSKWLSSGRVPGGEYEYIDVVFPGDREQLSERLIVDVDFQAQFEIARPSSQYSTALKILPAVFVGSSSKLDKILEFMSEAAKASLKQSQMPLPPWRTLDYMSSKWLSTSSDREIDDCNNALLQENHVRIDTSSRWTPSVRIDRSLTRNVPRIDTSELMENVPIDAPAPPMSSPPKRPRSFHGPKQCSEQLRHTKVALMAEINASGGFVTSKRSTRTTMSK